MTSLTVNLMSHVIKFESTASRNWQVASRSQFYTTSQNKHSYINRSRGALTPTRATHSLLAETRSSLKTTRLERLHSIM
jgi:ribosomal protein L33